MIIRSMAAAILAITSAALWGGADFLGGMSARRLHILTVTLFSQLAGLVTVTVIVVATGASVTGAGALWGIAAGVVGSLTFAIFYAALAAGAMSLVAPLSAVGAVVPVGVGIASGDVPGVVALSGIAFALAGVILIAGSEGAPLSLTPRVLALAAGAALGIGLVLTFLQLGSDAGDSSGLAVVAVARAASVGATLAGVIATRTVPRARLGALPAVAAVGVADTGANALFALASEAGSNTLVALLGSLYPVTTVVLARVLLAERLAARQLLGVALALGGAALVSTG